MVLSQKDTKVKVKHEQAIAGYKIYMKKQPKAELSMKSSHFGKFLK
jgi:hypothetical protein